jgi:hypothetical protein
MVAVAVVATGRPRLPRHKPRARNLSNPAKAAPLVSADFPAYASQVEPACRRQVSQNYAGTSPITKASGQTARRTGPTARNRRLADACYLWAFSSLDINAGARASMTQRRVPGDTHHRALRALANRLVGILHRCLRHGALYDEETAWGHRVEQAA